MKKRIILPLVLLTFMSACSDSDQQKQTTSAPPATPAKPGGEAASSNKQPGFSSVTPQQAKDLLGSRKDLLVVDVRGPEELKAGAIEGSQLVPIWTIMRGQHNLPKDKPILLVCAVGGRSYAAGQLLARNGYTEVYNLSGGIDAWKKAGMPLKY